MKIGCLGVRVCFGEHVRRPYQVCVVFTGCLTRGPTVLVLLAGFENQLRDSLRMYCMHAAKAEEETVSADCGEARVELAWGPDAQTIRCESVGLVR